MNAPNPAQHRAITTTAGPVLIIAGPDFGGSGLRRLAVPVRPMAAGDMPVAMKVPTFSVRIDVPTP